MGCKRFGGKAQARKICLILDIEQYRYQKFISDIAGQDIRTHEGKSGGAIRAVRNWLATASKRQALPGAKTVAGHYKRFSRELPRLCQEAELDTDDLAFSDLSDLIVGWLKTSR